MPTPEPLENGKKSNGKKSAGAKKSMKGLMGGGKKEGVNTDSYF